MISLIKLLTMNFIQQPFRKCLFLLSHPKNGKKRVFGLLLCNHGYYILTKNVHNCMKIIEINNIECSTNLFHNKT